MDMKRTVIPRLHDTGMNFRAGMKISLRHKNRGELAPVWLAPAWHFVLVSCKRIQSHKREPEWTRARMKVAPISCKHPLTLGVFPLVTSAFIPWRWRDWFRLVLQPSFPHAVSESISNRADHSWELRTANQNNCNAINTDNDNNKWVLKNALYITRMSQCFS